MFGVAGRWRLDPTMASRQEESLREIVEGVRTLPGFVRGFWSRDLSDSTTSLTYIVFQTREQAASFKRAVEGNVTGQGSAGVERNELWLVEIVADA